MVACVIENGSGIGENFREVLSYNPCMVPEAQHYHLSMACSHCNDPVCVRQCPSAAISKDPAGGIVEIDEVSCIGCRYCSWVCPFNAPVFSDREGMMQKCDLCRERVDEGLKPACETVCPTGALRTEISDPLDSVQEIPYFPDTDMAPAVRIAAPGGSPPEVQQVVPMFSEQLVEAHTKGRDGSRVKTSLKDEWPLVLFTLMIPVMGGLLAGDLSGRFSVSSLIFGITGAVGILVSLLHLGRKTGALRILRNFRYSWLSRESLFYGIFFILALLSLSGTAGTVTGIAGMASVLLAAVSADMIYLKSECEGTIGLHSAGVLLTLLLMVSYTTGFFTGSLLLLLTKFVLYLRRKLKNGMNITGERLLAAVRIFSGILLPSGMILFSEERGIFLFMLIAAGELADRIEFYREFKILTPEKRMNLYFQEEIRKTSPGTPPPSV